MSELLTATWWSLAGQRALRSFLVGLLPFLPAVVAGDSLALWAALSTGALLAVLSLATSGANLPEVDGLPRPWWLAALDRTVRTFAQALVANIPAVTLIQDVPWQVVLTNAAAAAAGSLVLAIVSQLPETQAVAIPGEVVVETVDRDGKVIAGDAHPLPTGTVVRNQP